MYIYTLLKERHVVEAAHVEADDSKDAQIQAIALCDGRHDTTGIDLWLHDRKVYHYNRPLAAD